jgi:serine/threonine protein kinase/Tfp pilus assembly protein PilF
LLVDENSELKAGQTIGHYEILSPLGKGGMGEVYLVQDTKLGRKVALKFLSAAFTTNQDRLRRFEQEARSASALNHPNILTIHEIGEADGRRFIATEFIDGETLRQRIIGGSLRFTEALNIAEQMGSALAAAHAAGIIHRDIKPENVMARRDGIVKVLDFGLAKLSEPPAVAGGSETHEEAQTRIKIQTNTGVVMGTVTYMSPEQARGLTVDARTDIWSLGVVFYEMLAGRAPFAGQTTSDILVSILEREPTSLASLCPDMPEAVEWIVTKALTKERDGRYQTATEILSDLRRVKNRLALASEMELMSPRPRHSQALVSGEQVPSIAVLPFVNMSAEPENEYFCDGLAEELINALTKIDRLRVPARTSAFSFKGKAIDVREIGQKLNVNNVLEGSVRKAGNRLRITAQLINVEDGYHLWSERYDREMEDVFAIQDEITLAIVDKLKLKLLREEKAALLDRYRENLEAYNLYLKGRYYWSRRPLEIRKAVECFEEAIEKDPDYALAYAGLADCYNHLGSWENGTLAALEAMPKAKAAANKALELDDTLVEAHTSLAYSVMHYDWDWRAAESRYQLAFDINPNYANAHHWYSHYLTATGRTEESLAESKRYLELDPLDLLANGHLAWHYLFARQYDEAIEQCWKTNELYPNSFWPSFFFALAYEQKGVIEKASVEFERAIKMSGNITFARAGLGHLFAISDRKSEARRVVRELKHLANERYVPSYDLAVIHAGLDEKDQAFDCLEKAYQEHSSWMAYLKTEPRLDPLRSDPRFTDLMRRIRLGP